MLPSNPNIPNIVLGEDYDKKYAHAPIHYDSLTNLASFFGRSMPVHRHPQYWQIHFVETNQVHFHIDDRHYLVEGPCCFVTPAAVPHSFLFTEAAVGHVITIHQSLIWQLVNENTLHNVQLGGSSGFCITSDKLTLQQQKDWQLLIQTLDHIKSEWELNAAGKLIIINSLINVLMVVLFRLSPQNNQGAILDDDDFTLYRKFSDMVEECYTQHWKLERYTQKLGVSENRLNQICQRICKKPPKKLINERLLQEARRLLVHTGSSCNEISYNLGFTDPTYFSRFFKKQTGQTGQQYRKNNHSV